MNAQYGIQNDKMKNWDTNTEGYTSEEKGVADQIAAFAESKQTKLRLNKIKKSREFSLWIFYVKQKLS